MSTIPNKDLLDMWIGLVRISATENPYRIQQMAELTVELADDDEAWYKILTIAAVTTRKTLEGLADSLSLGITGNDLVELMQQTADKIEI